MEFKEFSAGIDDDGRRLDRIIRRLMPKQSLSSVYKYIRKGLVRVNGKKAEETYRVKAGDTISLAAFILAQSPEPAQESFGSLPPVAFMNGDILIMEKPYDVTVHGTEHSLDALVRSFYRERLQDRSPSLSFAPGPLHRLDRRTTGLCAFSLSLRGAQWFSEGLRNHTIKKTYIGLAEGHLERTETWEDRLSDGQDKDGFFTVTAAADGKRAVTTARPVAHGLTGNMPVTLVEFDLLTGRTHQIRCQGALHGHPLAGDTAYGARAIHAPQEFFLHARELRFPPENPLGLPERVLSEPGNPFKNFLKSCGIEKIDL